VCTADADRDAVRTRWVDYAKHDFDSAQTEPGWHAWLAYMVDKSPAEDALLQTKTRTWERPGQLPNFTATRGAYKPYSTTKPKLYTWEPKAAERQ
jgi:NADH:ubiquinone oxidoreductase subunit